MTKRAPLATVYCRRCNSLHAEGEHLAKPKRLVTVAELNGQPEPEASKALRKGARELAEKVAARIFNDTTLVDAAAVEVTPRNIKEMDADGVSLTSTAHPIGPGPGRGHRIKKSSVETVEVELPDPLPIPNADKKRTKAAAQAAVAAEEARKRELRNARQKRWRKKTKKKAKKK